MNNHRGSDLMAIKMEPERGSGKTEVYITDAVQHHMFLRHHYATALGLTDIRHGKWAFSVMLENHLMAIKMGPVAEVQILSADSPYPSFHQTKTAIPISSTDRGEWAFEVMRNDDLMVMMKGPDDRAVAGPRCTCCLRVRIIKVFRCKLARGLPFKPCATTI